MFLTATLRCCRTGPLIIQTASAHQSLRQEAAPELALEQELGVSNVCSLYESRVSARGRRKVLLQAYEG